MAPELRAAPLPNATAVVDFAELYTVAVRRALLDARAQQLSVSFDCRNPTMLYCEPASLERSLHRLLCGAIALCPSGLVTFDAEARALRSARTQLRIRVAAAAQTSSEATVAATLRKLQLAEVDVAETVPPQLRRARGLCPLTGGLITFSRSVAAGAFVEYEQSFDSAGHDGERAGARRAGALAWLIDADAAPAAALERRLQRLGWATTGFLSTRHALQRLHAMQARQPRPALIVAARPDRRSANELRQLAALLPASSLCLLAVPVGSPLLARPDGVPGIELRVAPLSPGELERLTAALAPLADRADAFARPAASASAAARSPTLLVVDDDDVCRDVAAMHGASLGFEVRRARDGIEAIEACLHAAPAALLIDLSMPRLDGIGASERLRALQRTGALAPFPIVALTGEDDPRTRRRCLRAGMDGVLAKPLVRSELQYEMQRVRAGCVIDGTIGAAHRGGP